MAKLKGLFVKRCPHCGNSDSIYYKRGFMGQTVAGCRRCDEKVEKLRKHGLSKSEIDDVMDL